MKILTLLLALMCLAKAEEKVELLGQKEFKDIGTIVLQRTTLSEEEIKRRFTGKEYDLIKNNPNFDKFYATLIKPDKSTVDLWVQYYQRRKEIIYPIDPKRDAFYYFDIYYNPESGIFSLLFGSDDYLKVVYFKTPPYPGEPVLDMESNGIKRNPSMTDRWWLLGFPNHISPKNVKNAFFKTDGNILNIIVQMNDGKERNFKRTEEGWVEIK